MRLHKLVQPVNWKYALGEFVRIVAGILIALWLNEWSDHRRDRAAELQLLRRMRSALTEDLVDNRTGYDAFKQARLRILELQRHLNQRVLRRTRSRRTRTARAAPHYFGPYRIIRARADLRRT